MPPSTCCPRRSSAFASVVWRGKERLEIICLCMHDVQGFWTVGLYSVCIKVIHFPSYTSCNFVGVLCLFDKVPRIMFIAVVKLPSVCMCTFFCQPAQTKWFVLCMIRLSVVPMQFSGQKASGNRFCRFFLERMCLL